MSTKTWLGIIGLGSAVLLAALVPLAFTKDKVLQPKTVQLVQSYVHDADAFSQGLVVDNGQMWEGTGQYGKSTLRKVDIESGKVLASVALNQQYFGEGITLLEGKIYQLTWREKVCLIYDAETLKSVGSFKYTGEGWGLATDGKLLYMSDGSYSIRVIDPEKFTVVRRLSVHQGSRKIDQLNELEFVNGELWSNVWHSDLIARISPKNGEVLGWIDASQLWPAGQRPTIEHVLNGIAYDTTTKKLFMTGKNWPNLFEVTIP